MVFGNNIQGQHPVDWPGEPGLRTATPEFREGQPRSGEAPEAQTPQEALTHIDLLYKSGRMGELAVLLRRSEVFREAWRLVQQSSLSGLGTRGAGLITAEPRPAQGSEAFPVPQARLPGPSGGPASPPEKYGSSALTVSGPDAGLAKRARPAGKFSPPHNAAFEAYRQMAGDGAQKPKAAQHISIRV